MIFELREAVREREAELDTVNAESNADAEVHHMPRRVLAGQEEFVWQELSAEDEIAGESRQSFDDLKIINMVAAELRGRSAARVAHCAEPLTRARACPARLAEGASYLSMSPTT